MYPWLTKQYIITNDNNRVLITGHPILRLYRQAVNMPGISPLEGQYLQGEQEALKFGKENGQYSVYILSSGTEVIIE